MRTLLLDCGIFTNVNSNQSELVQISGLPLCNLSTLTSQWTKSTVERNPTSDHRRQVVEKSPRTMNQVTIVRSRILYARPALNAHGNIRFGLQHIHVLNRFPSADNHQHTVHIMKYIFPRQFNLHNVFTCITNPTETVQPFHDYTLRESEIKEAEEKTNRGHRSACWLPRRLRRFPLQLVQQIQKRHARCSYTSLLRHYCSLTLSSLPRMEETVPTPITTALKTQISAQLSSVTLPSRDSQAGLAVRSQPCITDYATPMAHVSGYCRAVLHQILPASTFGNGVQGRRNQAKFYEAINEFIRMRRFESLSLHRVMQNLTVSAIPWLCPPTMDARTTLSNSDFGKRRELLAEFLYYVFDSLLIPLIKSSFYVTESSMHRNQLFYFRHDIWRKLCEPSLRNLKADNFDELAPRTAKDLLRSKTLGSSQLRLLPKRTGMRPIINLKRRSITKRNGKLLLGPSTNSALAPVFSMLNYERVTQSERLGAALFSMGEIHARIRDFKQRIGMVSGRKLYFVKADVQSCFDSMPQEGLVDYVKNLVSTYQYFVSKHAEIKAADTRWSVTSAAPYRKFIMTAQPAGKDQPSDVRNMTPLSGRKKKLMVDTGYKKLYDARRLLKLLEEHVTTNLVRIGKRCYRQKKGIPQGSVLSSLLCNFFYGAFESSKLAFLGEDSLLLRLIDDFLLITTNQSHARRFLQIMADGSEEFGICTNPAKSLVNFEVSINAARVPQLQGFQGFPYCGMLIGLESLEISKDRRRDDLEVRHALSVETNRAPGKVFQRRILNAFKIQMHAMVVDTRLNDVVHAMSSLHQIHLETAMKMHCYLKTFRNAQSPDQRLMIRMCEDLLRLAINLTRGERSTKLIEKYECTVTATQHKWLMAVAFQSVLDRKQSRYSQVLLWLRQSEQESRFSMGGHTGKLTQLVESSKGPFAGYRY